MVACGNRGRYVGACAMLLLLGIVRAHAEGAFAFGRDASGRSWYGFATNERSPTRSIELAMARCRQKGPSCELVRQFKLGCFASATPDPGSSAGMGTGVNQRDAESRALSYCSEYSGGRPCTVKHAFCDSVDGPLSEVVAQRQQTEALARQQDISNAQGSSCSLSAKAISYAHRICAGGTCDAKFGVIEIVGKNVLGYAGGRTGIQYELGRTNEATQDAAALAQQLRADGTIKDQPQGTTERGFATASYDGRLLSLYLTQLTVARSHSNLPDDTLLSAMMMTSKIRVEECSTCTVVEFGISGYTIGGASVLPAFLNAPITEQACKIDAMR